jgi:putative endonuclease
MKSPLRGLFKTRIQSTGQQAEDEACKYLIRNGLKAVTRNYRCKYGEIDLIMQDEDTLVFIEVRYRKNIRFGSSAETVTLGKQKKLIIAAQHFIQSEPRLQSSPCRFDVVALSPDSTSKKSGPAIDWIRNAFTAGN